MTAFGVNTSIDSLTSEQRLAAGTQSRHIFIEAGPGTGKTTVSAHRFAIQRFGREFRGDDRAVVAVSFTRSATRNLVRRVQRLWGPSAMSWPHRIVTLDTIMSDLVHELLKSGLLKWPNGSTTLNVFDSWASFGGSMWNRTAYEISIVGDQVEFKRSWVESYRSSIPATVSVPLLLQGTCTHDDVREVLERALTNPVIALFVAEQLRVRMRALIVDEVFDANDLDIAIIELAINAGIDVTLVGDPWQALYVFRGARPEVVPFLLQRTGTRRLSLTHSFRWKSSEQRELAQRLRLGEPVILPARHHSSGVDDLDVVLALTWKPLWDLGGGVLPLAFQGFKGGAEEAAATLLLNYVTRNILGLDATYLRDALTALAITDPDVPQLLEPGLQVVADSLRTPGRSALNSAYSQLVEIVNTVSPRHIRPARAAHTRRLAQIQERLAHDRRAVPGLTTHQAKGGEWGKVGVRLTDAERLALSVGLSVTEDNDRKLYVACTRARYFTIELA